MIWNYLSELNWTVSENYKILKNEQKVFTKTYKHWSNATKADGIQEWYANNIGQEYRRQNLNADFLVLIFFYIIPVTLVIYFFLVFKMLQDEELLKNIP